MKEFPQDLTEEEKELGFDLIELENPSNSRSDFRFRLAVVFLVNETDVSAAFSKKIVAQRTDSVFLKIGVRSCERIPSGPN